MLQLQFDAYEPAATVASQFCRAHRMSVAYQQQVEGFVAMHQQQWMTAHPTAVAVRQQQLATATAFRERCRPARVREDGCKREGKENVSWLEKP